MPYVRDDHLPDSIPLFALECDDFLSHTRDLDFESEVSAHGRLSARKRFALAFGFQRIALGGWNSLPAAAGLDLLFARPDIKYKFRRWLSQT